MKSWIIAVLALLIWPQVAVSGDCCEPEDAAPPAKVVAAAKRVVKLGDPVLDRMTSLSDEARGKLRKALLDFDRKESEIIRWCMGEFQKKKQPMRECMTRHRANKAALEKAVLAEMTAEEKALYKKARAFLQKAAKRGQQLIQRRVAAQQDEKNLGTRLDKFFAEQTQAKPVPEPKPEPEPEPAPEAEEGV